MVRNIILIIFLFSMSAFAQSDKLEVRSSETMFTFFSFVTLNKYSEADTSKLNSTQKFVRQRLTDKLSDEYEIQLKQEFQKYNNRMFEYWLTMLALNCTEPPEIKSRIAELEEYNKKNNIKSGLENLKNLEPLLTVINKFYEKAEIGQIYKECSVWYDSALQVYREGTLTEIRKVLEYLHMDESPFFDKLDKIVIIPNLIGPRGAAMGPVYMGIKYDVQCPYEDYINQISITPHEYIHDMVKHLTKSEEYKEQIIEITSAVWDSISNSDAVKYYNDKVLYFDECLVRTIDHITSFYEEEKLRRILEKNQVPKGFVLVVPMTEIIKQNNGMSFDMFFPELLTRMKNKL